MDLKVGCGGWWDFPGGLEAYAQRFSFVEVNSSYYRLPSLEAARRWRRSVPDGFEFSVKAPRERPSAPDQFLDLLATLQARYAVVHASSSWKDEALQCLQDHGHIPVLEARGSALESPLPDSKRVTSFSSVHGGRDAYLRVFGVTRGILHHLGDGMVHEVVAAVRRHEASGAERVRVVTHTVQMYDDAERIRRLSRGGTDG